MKKFSAILLTGLLVLFFAGCSAKNISQTPAVTNTAPIQATAASSNSQQSTQVPNTTATAAPGEAASTLSQGILQAVEGLEDLDTVTEQDTIVATPLP